MKARKSFRDCIVKPGEMSPYANLLVDLAFKKAFDPDKPASRKKLINLLNDLLEPQLKSSRSYFVNPDARSFNGSKPNFSRMLGMLIFGMFTLGSRTRKSRSVVRSVSEFR